LVSARATGDVPAETARVRAHLARVEAELRSKDVSALTATQREARARNLDVLHEYWVRGAFPVNTDFPGRRVPYFVDRYGTLCAMAYLIEQSGRGDLVARIASTDNNAYVRDLQNDAELGAWLRDNGLTAAEAARIQPSYAPNRRPPPGFAGRWVGKASFGSKDSAVVSVVLTATDSAEGWTLTFANQVPIPLRVVSFYGDSLIAEAGPAAAMTAVRNALHYGGNTLTGTIEVRYTSGASARGRFEAALKCPGPAAPADVVTFVRHAGVSNVRCITATGVVLDGQGTVFEVTHRDAQRQGWLVRRMALRWRGRAGWILERGTPFDSVAPGTFRVRPSDSFLATRAFLTDMTARGLRLQWATTLLHDPDAPRFVPVAFIAALKDTVDEGLAALLVSAPRVTRDPELLVELVHLPVAPDSAHRTSDGSTSYFTVVTGYGKARNEAARLLWNQSLALIAAPSTSSRVLLTIATWTDRHPFWCVWRPTPGEVFAALGARATRDRDNPLLATLARVRVPCQ
jgi:hypothetical protein